MSSRVASTEPAKVSREALTAILWTGVAVSLCFLAFRGYVRLKIFRRFFLDDILLLSAWLIFLANVILYQVMLPTVYLLIQVYEAVDTEGLAAIPEDFPAKRDFFFHAYMDSVFVSWCCLWAVKASFLAFFRKLGHNVARQNVLWWCALSITVIGFVINFAIWDYKCSVGRIAINTSKSLPVGSVLAGECLILLSMRRICFIASSRARCLPDNHRAGYSLGLFQ